MFASMNSFAHSVSCCWDCLAISDWPAGVTVGLDGNPIDHRIE